MIAKSTVNLVTNGLAVTNGGSFVGPWVDVSKAVKATTRVTTILAAANNAHPEVIIEVADDLAGTNPAKVLRAAVVKANGVLDVLRHRHAITDRFIRVLANNPGTTVGADLTINAQVDLVTNIG